MTLFARLLALLAAWATLSAAARAAGLELVMVEQPGCAYCALWDAEVGPGYAKSSEGRAAPLRRIPLHGKPPADLVLAAPPVFTPTFILVRDGREIGRLEGYPGADFFWPMVADLIARADPP
jgi:hypothetical protein